MLRTILKPLSFVPALIMMYIIFSFSAQDGDMSGQLSYQASVKIIETADYVFNANLSYDQIDEWANKIDFITRKLAHMTEYFALAIAVSFPLYVYGLHGILLMFLAGSPAEMNSTNRLSPDEVLRQEMSVSTVSACFLGSSSSASSAGPDGRRSLKKKSK